MESQGGPGASEGGGGDGQSGQAASTALIEKILSEEPRWQGKADHFDQGGGCGGNIHVIKSII